jgi:aminobenzoyl-glutamate utilization protein B
MDYEVMHGNYPVLPNETLARKVYENLVALGGVTYTADEERFARELRTSLLGALPDLASVGEVQPFKLRQTMGSTDVGDVSWNVPTVGFYAATWVSGTSSHSWQAVAAGGMSIGHKGMVLATKVLSLTTADLLVDPELIRAAKIELAKRQGEDFEYRALLGDRQPPLDYRR